ncbi:putative alpha/beta hydrolase [Prochlorococcus marinus str. LG]|uniref:alpha/beta fold hydrolase n=2 Tax=Prochlorococcus marinus TaxID=1219 RepID=UPI000533B635|nr:putative alpha/beta hydrolase [Prochlorococcus marinus str. LG]
MIKEVSNTFMELNKVKNSLIDPLAVKLTESVNWLYIDGVSENTSDVYPISIIGEGPPILLLHGFDSCFMEYRRLAPYLNGRFKLIIPDLYGFGFCPRPKKETYGIKPIINHLIKLLKTLKYTSGVGLIGASMGGGIALQFAREYPSIINKILLLSPAGILGEPKPIPPPLDSLGACFLKQSFVRTMLCKQAFSNPIHAGKAEIQIASIHTNVPGWKRSLAAFAREGGIANCGLPLPEQPLSIIWGENDRILSKALRNNCIELLNCSHKRLEKCGHLPHIDKPDLVASHWEEYD